MGHRAGQAFVKSRAAWRGGSRLGANPDPPKTASLILQEIGEHLAQRLRVARVPADNADRQSGASPNCCGVVYMVPSWPTIVKNDHAGSTLAQAAPTTPSLFRLEALPPIGRRLRQNQKRVHHLTRQWWPTMVLSMSSRSHSFDKNIAPRRVSSSARLSTSQSAVNTMTAERTLSRRNLRRYSSPSMSGK